VVEIKPLSLINDGFIPELLDVPKTFLADLVVQKYGTNKGFLFKFSPPSSLGHGWPKHPVIAARK
jgi:hypothetical protein